MKEFIQKQIADLNLSINTGLPNYNSVKPSDALKTLLAYDMVFRPNFILWLMLMKGKERTAKGIEVVGDNLKCEIEENHPQLLLNTLVPTLSLFTDIGSTEQVYKDVDILMMPIMVNEVRSLTLSSASTDGFFIMAMLENASLTFIPWLKQIVEHRLPVGDVTYFNIHGEADKEHAVAFLDAANDEYIQRAITNGGIDISRRKMVYSSQKKRMVEITEKLKAVFEGIFSFVKKSELV